MTFRLRVIASILLAASVLLSAAVAVCAAGNKLGDADGDGDVTVVDATFIQRKLAGLRADGFSESAADADGNGEIEIIDAAYILRWVDGQDTPYPIGEQPASPTEAPTQRPTDEDGWGRDIFRP